MTALRVLLYADMRIHHSHGVLRGLQECGHDVRVISSMSDNHPEGSPTSSEQHATDPVARLRRRLVSTGLNVRVRQALRTSPDASVDPLQVADTALAHVRRRGQSTVLRQAVQEFNPHVVHAARVPFEALLALSALTEVARQPVSIATWGQDFRYQAARDPLMRRWLRSALPRADAIHVDAASDLARAQGYGVRPDVPSLFAPGNLGVDSTLFRGVVKESLVVYPRGVLPYVNHEAFLALVRANRGSGIRFVGLGLADDPAAQAVASESSYSLTLSTTLTREEYAHLLSTARLVVSPAYSDGTPNSVLEALASGCRVIAGELDTLEAVSNDDSSVMLLDPRRAEQWAIPLMDQPWWHDTNHHSRLRPEFERTHAVERFDEFIRDVARGSPKH